MAKGQLLAALAVALGFPSYFGENWDAFEECLRDAQEEARVPAVVEITASAGLRAKLPTDVATLEEIWSDVASEAGQHARSLHLVLT